MEPRGRAVPSGTATSPESAVASELFDQFVSAGTFKSVLFTYRQICDVLRLKPTNIPNFYPRLKAKLHSWRAASLWAKLDKRASHKCYNRGKACPNTRVIINYFIVCLDYLYKITYLHCIVQIFINLLCCKKSSFLLFLFKTEEHKNDKCKTERVSP